AEGSEVLGGVLGLDAEVIGVERWLEITIIARVLDNMTDTAAADLARADKLAGQALEASPRSPLAHYAKAQVLRAQGRYGDAILEYETVLALNRNWVNAYAHVGQCKIFTGSIGEAFPLVGQAVRLSPRDPAGGIF